MNFWTRKDRFGNTVPNAGRIVPLIVGIFLTLVTMMTGCFTVDQGERTVILRFGKVNRVADPGLHFKIPLFEARRTMDIRVRKMLTESDASSKDLQVVHSEIALNYNVMPDKVADVYSGVGSEWEVIVIEPSIREAFKAVTARYTAEELILKRPEVSLAIGKDLREALLVYGLNVSDISITDFDFSDDFNRAIEAKVTAEQNALKASRDLERIKIEADQAAAAANGRAQAAVIEAEGQAKVLRLQRAEITDDLLRKIALEKWDGVLPTVTGGAIPFINVPTK